MRITGGVIVLMILFSGGCADLEPVEVEAYYDVDSLVTAQYQELKNSGLQIRKQSMVNGDMDTSIVQPSDTSSWLYELNVFRKANINKPVLRGVYQVERKEDASGHTVTYLPDEPEERTVRYLKLVFEQDHLREVHARIKESNPVYGSERELAMYFSGEGETNRLIRYDVSGIQKMILKDTVRLSVSSEILYDSK
jgi:hypothetical protein